MRKSAKKDHGTDDFNEKELREKYRKLSGVNLSEELLNVVSLQFKGDRIQALCFLVKREMDVDL